MPSAKWVANFQRPVLAIGPQHPPEISGEEFKESRQFHPDQIGGLELGGGAFFTYQFSSMLIYTLEVGSIGAFATVSGSRDAGNQTLLIPPYIILFEGKAFAYGAHLSLVNDLGTLMIDFTYDRESDTFIGVTEIGVYLASPTGRRDVRDTDHPYKNTVVYAMTFQPKGAEASRRRVLGEGREATVTVQALEHYIQNDVLVRCPET
jgi:hypothetical protein